MIAALLGLVLLASDPDSERELDAALPLSGVRRVEVEHSQGELTILPAPADQGARAELRLGASGGGPEAEKAFLAGFSLAVETGEDGRLIVRTLMPEAETKPPEMSYVAALWLWLPRELPVKALNRYGRLQVDGRDAAVEAHCRLGPIEVKGVRGDLQLGVEYDRARVEDVHGDVVLEANSEELLVRGVVGDVDIVNKFGEIEVEDVEGRVTVANRKGTIRVTRIRDGVDLRSPLGNVIGRELGGASIVRSMSARVDLERCPGSVEVEHRHGEVHVADVRGEVRIRGAFIPTTARRLGGDLHLITTASDLDVDDVAGDCTVEGETGRIRLRNLRGDLEANGQGGLMELIVERWPEERVSWTLENRSSPLELSLPDDADVQLELRSTLGVIESAFPGLVVRKDGSVATASQKLGDGRSEARLTAVGAVLRVLESAQRDERE